MESHPATKPLSKRLAPIGILVCLGVCMGLTGCTAILNPIAAIPADRIPPQFLKEPQADKRPIDLALLGQAQPEHYILDAGDVLGVFIEGVLGTETEPPPVQLPEPTSDLDPSIGFPIPVREDGTISLPYIEPISVRGLTIPQTEALVNKTYVEKGVLVAPQAIVTLMRKRTFRVFVVRQDNTFSGNARSNILARSQAVFDRPDLSSRGFVLQMRAYENDVMNALTQTGGLPGLNAKAEVTILRAERNRAERERQLNDFYSRNVPGSFPWGVIPNRPEETENVQTIKLRARPGEPLGFRAEDIILNEGDIVYVETRDTEVYYTGGLLGGGEWPLPRDYDLDVLGAVSIAGVGVGTGVRGFGGGLLGAVGTAQPTELIVLRKLPGGRQLPIYVDLNRAINDPGNRLLVAPGDTLILRFKPEEELANFALATFFTYGIQQLFRGRR